MQQPYYSGLRVAQALAITSLLYACLGSNNGVPNLAVRDASRKAETTAGSTPPCCPESQTQGTRYAESPTQEIPARDQKAHTCCPEFATQGTRQTQELPASPVQPGPPADTKSAWALSPTQAYWQQLSEAQRSSLRTTTAIVEAFHKAQAPAARTALRAWLHAYVTWFDSQPLGIPQAQVQEYMTLAAIRPQGAADQELLRRYLGSFINKVSVQEYHANEEAAIEAMATRLPLLSPTIFQGRSKPLLELSELLAEKLERLGKDHLTARDYPAHRHTLEALHQALSMLRGIMDADKWCRKGGLYDRFRQTLTRLQAHAKAAQYYP